VALGLLVAAFVGGCSFGESGIAPPNNRIFLPAGMVIDPAGRFLYVVNSNSDLRYNAGTVVAVDLAVSCAIRPDLPICQATPSPSPASAFPVCSKTRFSRTEPVGDDYCCRDLVDSNIINCNEPQFIQGDATIQIGSFGGAVVLQDFIRAGGGPVRRLFVAVRAEPSITYADVTPSSDGAAVTMRCTGDRLDSTPPPLNAFCEDSWRIRRPGGASPGALEMPQEPHVLALDKGLGALFVGHLTVTANRQLQGGGMSALDICNPENDNPVRFAGLSRTTFLPASLTQAVATLSPGDPYPLLHPSPSLPQTVLYATARYSSAISGMVLEHPEGASCGDSDKTAPPTSEARDLTLIPSEHFYAPAFLPNGADIRGILFTSDGSRAYVLHRNDADTISSPAAIEVLDRRRLSDGTTPSNTPITVLGVCSGPSSMQWHNSGRGDRIFVTCYDDGLIYVVDPVALDFSAIDVGVAPTSLVFSTQDPGIAYVASFFNSHLSVIDLRPGSPTENRVLLRIGLPHGYGE
jgi:hypothetical protein